jgi:hypothetical protein
MTPALEAFGDMGDKEEIGMDAAKLRMSMEMK